MKAFKFIIAVFFMVIVSACTALADTGSMTIDSQVNYDMSKIVVRVHTPAGYIQRISAVLYKANIPTPLLSDYIRIDEKVSDPDGAAVLEFPMGNDITTDNYNISVFGSGYMADSSMATKTIKIIGLSEMSTIITNINSATQGNIEQYIAQIADTVGIVFDNEYAQNKENILSLLISIKNNDFNGAFLSGTQVKSAWDYVKIIRSMNNASGVSVLKGILEGNKSIFNIDISLKDYTDAKDDVCTVLSGIIKKAGLNCTSQVAGLYQEAIAVSTINRSSVTDKEIYIKKYASLFQIESYLARYNKIDKIKVARLLDGRNFADANEVRNQFIAALDKVEGNTGNGGGGGNGGGSIGKVNSTVTSDIVPVPTVPQGNTFKDISEYAWAEKSVTALSEMNIIKGYEDGTFKGTKTVKREEFIKMLVLAFNLLDEGSTCDFSDVKDSDWQYKYVASAKKAGLVTGRDDGSFGSGEDIERQDMAVMIYRAGKAGGISFESVNPRSNFTDESNISDYASESIFALQQAGVINGFEDGSFAPRNGLSRAEAAKVIYELMLRN